LNAVGGDCPGKTELHPEILRRPDVRIVVEYASETRVEREIQQMPPDFPVIEFAELVRQRIAGRSNAAEVTIFDSVGFAVEDYSALRFLLRRKSEGARHIDLIPALADPKDLFGGTLRPRVMAEHAAPAAAPACAKHHRFGHSEMMARSASIACA
jgi:ornithine cyclodeaminase